jgi:hypothetical protein
MYAKNIETPLLILHSRVQRFEVLIDWFDRYLKR